MSTKYLAEVAEHGDRLSTMIALRQKLAEAIDNSNSGRDVAALSRQLVQVTETIVELEKQKELEDEDTVIDIVRRNHASKVRDSRRRALNIGDDYDDE